jgi:uncharacterized protein YneF (UPF0154 family)
MNLLLIFLAIIVIVCIGIFIATKYFNVYTDDNNNGIPDKIEDTFSNIKTEASIRVSKVKEETHDVKKALKQVVKQTGDVVKVATKKTGNRRGRKPN